MRRLIFAFIPTGAVLLYVLCQFSAYEIMGRMFFSSLFILELASFTSLGAIYIGMAARLDRSEYLRPAIAGLIVGTVAFLGAGVELFLSFEFARNLSV
jgi:hypothetical protein